MIKKKLEQIHNEITLCSREFFAGAEKGKIKETLISFMDAHPFSAFGIEEEYSSQNEGVTFDLFSFGNKMKFASAILVVSLTLGASVSYAAQDALPGDSLYGIKTNVNEGVRGWLARSSLQEAKLHVEFAEERIKETEKLVAKGGIKPEVASELEKNFRKQADAVDENIGELTLDNKHEDALEVSGQFESSLKAHEDVLSNLKEESASSTVDALIGSVEDKIDSTKDTRALVEKKIKTDDSIHKETAKTKMQLAKEKISEVSSLVEQLQEMKLILKARNKGEEKLRKAEKTYDSGRSKYLRDSFSDSFVFFEKAKQEAEEANTYLTVSIDLEAERAKWEEAKKDRAVTPTPTSSATSTPTENASSTPVSGSATSTFSSDGVFGTTTIPSELEATTTINLNGGEFF